MNIVFREVENLLLLANDTHYNAHSALAPYR